jgi:hypothetical protein
MEELRDLLIQNGLTVKSASIVAIVAAILLCLLIGWLVKAADGSMRDAQSLLDQVIACSKTWS